MEAKKILNFNIIFFELSQQKLFQDFTSKNFESGKLSYLANFEVFWDRNQFKFFWSSMGLFLGTLDYSLFS